MVDMGQADRSLYFTPRAADTRMSWLFALRLAALQMGYALYIDVPDTHLDELKTLARAIRDTPPTQGGSRA